MTATFALVLARCAGFMFRAPGLSHPSVPHVVRAGLALLLTVAIAPGVHAAAVDGAGFLVLLVVEFVLGVAIGLAASAIYDGAYAGGRMIDDYVGVKAIAPSVAIVAPSGFGRVWSIAYTGGYFLLGTYRATILGFAQSFVRTPPGDASATHAWLYLAGNYLSTVVLAGIAVAAPAVALAFVTQVALAALTRAVPRFATFALSFPLVFGVALLAAAIAIPTLRLR